MKALKDIFSDFDQAADDAGAVVFFLKERFPKGRFHLVYSNGQEFYSDGTPLVTEDMQTEQMVQD